MEEPEPVEQGGDEAKKVKTKTWLDVVKGQKSGNELETPDLV